MAYKFLQKNGLYDKFLDVSLKWIQKLRFNIIDKFAQGVISNLQLSFNLN